MHIGRPMRPCIMLYMCCNTRPKSTTENAKDFFNYIMSFDLLKLHNISNQFVEETATQSKSARLTFSFSSALARSKRYFSAAVLCAWDKGISYRSGIRSPACHRGTWWTQTSSTTWSAKDVRGNKELHVICAKMRRLSMNNRPWPARV